MDLMFTKQRIDKLVSELGALRYSRIRPVKNIAVAPDAGNVHEKPEQYIDFENGDSWGGYDRHFWFRIRVPVPEEDEGRTVLLLINTGREGEWDATNPQFLAFINDHAVQGLDVNHRELFLTDSAAAGESFDISLYAYSGMFDRKAFFSCSLAVLEPDIEGLYYDLKAASDAVDCLDENDKRRIDILKYLENAVALIDFRKAYDYGESFLKSVADARVYMKDAFYKDYCGHEDVVVSGIGHTHIDVAWLWTLSQTREKAVRSFSTVLELMRRYPEYRFMSSQPQLYQFVREDMPEVYEGIKTKVKEGRWEPEGAMWLEADCNLTGGESIIRQIMFGKRFFKKEFNKESRVLWLPDVFGYSAALPQILNKCGIDYFITSKISWNEYNKAPYDTFLWEGIDGSAVPTYFITATDPGQDYEKNHRTTYNGVVQADTVSGTWGRYQQKNLSSRVLMPYGYGDGGGGPSREMLEYGRRLACGIPGIPKFEFDSLHHFVKELSSQVEKNRSKLPRWVGELYLEYHRGTYTTMARNKRYNRRAELRLMETEGLCTMTGTILDETYPAGELDKAWQTVLLNQFHDIIPGSSIKQVYEESKKQYENVFKTLEMISSKARDHIVENIAVESDSLVVFNPTGFSMGNLIETRLPDWCRSVKSPEGAILPVQRSYDGKSLIFAPSVPSKGYSVFELSKEEAPADGSMKVNDNIIENRYYRIELDENGLITSIFDKPNSREVIRKGEKGNKLTAFEDIPHNFDAWDINIYYRQKFWDITDAEKISVLERGPVRCTIEIRRRFLDSTVIQHIQVYNDSPRIDFKTHIDWKEKHILLKAAFPVEIHSDKAVYDIQFGNIERPTHWNTSWDMARFEVCGHKWADLSENGYGVSLMNDCKYGYDIKDGTMRLTLLKSAVSPNENADREEHDFIYSLLPHRGDFRTCTIPQAYALNMPFEAVISSPHAGKLPQSFSFAAVDQENVVLETIKRSEQGSDVILRMYEAYNRRGSVTLRLSLPVEEAWECDMLEEPVKKLRHKGNEVVMEMLPYEIKTVKLRFEKFE